MISPQSQNEKVPQAVDRVPSSLRRFGAGLVEQARLHAKFATAVAVASGTVAAAAPALGEDATPPSAIDSLFLVINPANNPSGLKVTPETNLAQYIDPAVKCGPDCRIELRCPGGKIEGIIFQETTVDGGVYAVVDKSRGQAGLAFCPSDLIPFTFVLPEYVALPPLSPILIQPPPQPSTPEASEGTAPPPAIAPEPHAATSEPPISASPPPEETAASPASPPESPRRAFAAEAGVEIPVASTHDLLRDPGVFVQVVGKPLDALAGARGVLRAAWNPITQKPAKDDARFYPRNPAKVLNGNAVRATAGLLYPYEVARGDGFSLDLQGGVDAGLAVLSVPRRKDVGVDKDGYLADIPGSDTITAVVEGHAELAAHFGKRLRLALGLRYGQSPFAVQTKAGARESAHANFMSVNAGLGVQF